MLQLPPRLLHLAGVRVERHAQSEHKEDDARLERGGEVCLFFVFGGGGRGFGGLEGVCGGVCSFFVVVVALGSGVSRAGLGFVGVLSRVFRPGRVVFESQETLRSIFNFCC